MEGGDHPSKEVRAGDGDGGSVTVNIQCSGGSNFTVWAELGSTVAVFKAILAARCEVPVGQQHLVYKGRILDDDQTLGSYGLQADHTLHLVRVSTPSSPSANALNVTNDGVSGSGILSLERISSITSSPQVREVLDKNPHLAHAVNRIDLRQTLEAARNPELWRELVRKRDRVFRRIESSPGGFNTLKRIYQTDLQALINATAMSQDDGNRNTGSNSSPDASTTGAERTTGLPGPNTDPLPNPWAGSGRRTNSTVTSQTNQRKGKGRDAGASRKLNMDMADVSPEQLYATQLSQLRAMGFLNTQENIRALTATNGDVNAAVDRLLGNHGGESS
ncbi:unnamed protein product [Victoria cruziana]